MVGGRDDDAAAPGQAAFAFAAAHRGVDWARVDRQPDPATLLDTDDRRAQADVLARTLPDVLYGALNDAQLAEVGEPAYKAFRMAQLSAQYLVHCQNVLAARSEAQTKQLDFGVDALRRLHEGFRHNKERKRRLKRELRKADALIAHYDLTLRTLYPELARRVRKTANGGVELDTEPDDTCVGADSPVHSARGRHAAELAQEARRLAAWEEKVALWKAQAKRGRATAERLAEVEQQLRALEAEAAARTPPATESVGTQAHAVAAQVHERATSPLADSRPQLESRLSQDSLQGQVAELGEHRQEEQQDHSPRFAARSPPDSPPPTSSGESGGEAQLLEGAAASYGKWRASAIGALEEDSLMGSPVARQQSPASQEADPDPDPDLRSSVATNALPTEMSDSSVIVNADEESKPAETEVEWDEYKSDSEAHPGLAESSEAEEKAREWRGGGENDTSANRTEEEEPDDTGPGPDWDIDAMRAMYDDVDKAMSIGAGFRTSSDAGATDSDAAVTDSEPREEDHEDDGEGDDNEEDMVAGDDDEDDGDEEEDDAEEAGSDEEDDEGDEEDGQGTPCARVDSTESGHGFGSLPLSPTTTLGASSAVEVGAQSDGASLDLSVSASGASTNRISDEDDEGDEGDEGDASDEDDEGDASNQGEESEESEEGADYAREGKSELVAAAVNQADSSPRSGISDVGRKTLMSPRSSVFDSDTSSQPRYGATGAAKSPASTMYDSESLHQHSPRSGLELQSEDDESHGYLEFHRGLAEQEEESVMIGSLRDSDLLGSSSLGHSTGAYEWDDEDDDAENSVLIGTMRSAGQDEQAAVASAAESVLAQSRDDEASTGQDEADEWFVGMPARETPSDEALAVTLESADLSKQLDLGPLGPRTQLWVRLELRPGGPAVDTPRQAAVAAASLHLDHTVTFLARGAHGLERRLRSVPSGDREVRVALLRAEAGESSSPQELASGTLPLQALGGGAAVALRSPEGHAGRVHLLVHRGGDVLARLCREHDPDANSSA